MGKMRDSCIGYCRTLIEIEFLQARHSGDDFQCGIVNGRHSLKIELDHSRKALEQCQAAPTETVNSAHAKIFELGKLSNVAYASVAYLVASADVQVSQAWKMAQGIDELL